MVNVYSFLPIPRTLLIQEMILLIKHIDNKTHHKKLIYMVPLDSTLTCPPLGGQDKFNKIYLFFCFDLFSGFLFGLSGDSRFGHRHLRHLFPHEFHLLLM